MSLLEAKDHKALASHVASKTLSVNRLIRVRRARLGIILNKGNYYKKEGKFQEIRKKKPFIPKDVKVEVNGKIYIRNTETIKKLHRKDPNPAIFITFKPIYDAARQELKMEVCEGIRKYRV